MKKITKFLDSVMGGIKRTCIAKALAVFAVASIAINANAAEAVDAQGVITGIDKLVGKTQDELLSKAVTSTTFPTDPEQQFFLYNVKTGRLLNAGGYWGTHVALKEYGKPLAVEDAGKTSKKQKIKLIMEMAGTEGKYVGWVGVPGASGKNPADIGTYIDRKSTDVYGWLLEPLSDDKNTYRLYTYAHSKFDENGVKWNTNKKFYLASNKGVLDADRNCEAYAVDSIANYEGYDEWRFLSYQQILDLQAKNADELNDALELSFKLKCPGFSRGDNDITSWKTYNYATQDRNTAGVDGFAFYGLNYYSNPIAGPNTNPSESEKEVNYQKIPPTWTSTLSETAYEFDGRKYDKDSLDNYKRYLAKYYTASITNKRGTVYQDIVVTTPGRYQIECKGYSTTEKAKLFAGVLKSDNMTMVGKVKTRTLNQVSNMSQAAKDSLHVLEKNVDYAGKNFYGSRKYINTVYVTVTDEDLRAGNGEATIRLGIRVGDDLNDNTVEGDEWTVFDDFRMLYAAKEVKEDLILDEMRDNLSYLVNCPTPMENKTLHLNKTFTLNKWNSFILPVNLNKKQVTEAFGGDARLAKLTGLSESGIEFTSVNLLDSNSTAIEAYMPYIIFPVKGPGQTEAYTANYQQNNNNTNERLNINIPANHYVIGKVSMPLTRTGDVKANDWSNMDQTNWTTTLTGGNNDIKAYGTFARTFGTVQTDNEDGTYTWTNDGKIIPGRDDLKDCYFFDKGNMYHSTKRARGLRGFSCWFKPVNSTAPSQDVNYTLDGVTQSGTTGIEDILADYEQPVSRFANGIYNLNGQLVKQGNSTAGLPSGLYIVNGKKCIVR
ncbi:MAG: hypothetical protein MR788_06720 [Prevotella sp.]|nr:hypothetical protein [Prevotella sp.]